jgi:hypothetical protein
MTLNQVLERIRINCLAHKQINRFFFGKEWELLNDKKSEYACVLCEDQGGSIDRSRNARILNFRLYFLDLVNVSEDTEGNEQEVLSDMLSVAEDIIALLNRYEYEDWMIQETSSLQLITEVYDDMNAGVYIDVSISVDYLTDRCQVPAEDITIETDSNDMRTYEAYRKCTGSEGTSLSLATDFTDLDGNTVDLRNKRVMFFMRSNTALKKITSGTPTVEEYKLTSTNAEVLNAVFPDETFFLLYRNNN